MVTQQISDHVIISHPWQRDTEKYATQGPSSYALRASGSIMGPSGDILWPAGGIFPVDRGQGCDINIILQSELKRGPSRLGVRYMAENKCHRATH